MKTKILILLSILWMTALSAEALIVQGTVTDSASGQPVAGHPIFIETLGNPQGGFSYQNMIFTDLSGNYADTIPQPPQGNAAFLISTYDCQMKQYYQVVSSNQPQVTVNFNICGGIVTACNAFFDWNPHPNNPRRIFFQDLSFGNYNDWQWSFGDGDFSTQPNPQHIYQQAGAYEVCLTISNNDSLNLCTSTFCDTIYVDPVGPPCQANFNWVPDNNDPHLIHFTDMSNGNPDNWLWNFGDGSFDTVQNPSHQFPGPGIYDVCLNIITFGQPGNPPCYDQLCLQVFVDSSMAPCHADFMHWPSVQDPLKMIFQDFSSGNINQWDWDFGDGSTGSGPIIDHIYADTGTYQVCLYISGPVCQDTLCKTIDVNSPGNYNIAGQVFGAFFPVPDVEVQLFRKVGGQYMLDQVTTTDTFGVYFFYQALGGEYILRARPNSQPSGMLQFLPTYFVSSHLWFMADEIPLYQDLFGADIMLRNRPGMMNGSGTVKGYVEYSDNREDGLSGPAPGIDVFLNGGNSMPLAMTTTDNSGYFEFNNVHFGNLSVHAEVTGITTIPANINLSASNPMVDNILLEVQPMMVLPVHQQDALDMAVGNPYPNPANEYIKLPLNWDKPASFELRIISASGKEILKTTVQHPGGIYDLQIELPQESTGLHVLQVISPEGGLINKKILITE